MANHCQTVTALNFVPENRRVKDCRSEKKKTGVNVAFQILFLAEEHQEQPMACHSRNLNCAGELQWIESINTVSPNTMKLSLWPLFISFSWMKEIIFVFPWENFKSSPI